MKTLEEVLKREEEEKNNNNKYIFGGQDNAVPAGRLKKLSYNVFEGIFIPGLLEHTEA